MNLLSLARKQGKILRKIRDCQHVESAPDSDNILNHIRQYNSAAVAQVMGEVGSRLLSFSNAIDRTHPDLKKVLDGELVNGGGSFNRIAIDILQAGIHCLENGSSRHVLEALYDVIRNHSVSTLILRCLENPSRNLLFIRFLPSRSLRDECRNTKHVQKIFGSKFYDLDLEDYADNFDLFVRGESWYKNDIEEATSRLEHFRNMNLPTLASQIERSIEQIKLESSKNQHFGFNKIELSEAAHIVGKMHGCLRTALPDGMFNILAPPEIQPNSDYCPRLYTHIDWISAMPPKVKEIIDFLEEYPEINRKSLFDHYQVLVPGIPATDLDFDKDLVQQKKIVPILLGERDGSHYFICYWI